MRVLFLARSLDVGGAERQLVVLVRGLARAGCDVAVAVFYAGGAFEAELRQDGIPVHDLAKRGRWGNAGLMFRLVRLVRRERPDVVHSYLDSPNLAAVALKRLCPSIKVVWGVRSAMTDFGAYDWLSSFSARVERLAAPLADAIITNSEAARGQALSLGLDRRNVAVIPNGIDVDSFRPDPGGRERLRREWGVAPEERLVGMVARLDPVKNHPNFLRAAAMVASARADVRFACVGGGPAAYRWELEELASALGLRPRLVWTGERRATRNEFSALDVAVLSSDAGEGFPNVVAEAMACGRPVVATDSGDVRVIVGDTGVVVSPRDPGALARGIVALLDRVDASGGELSRAARRRIEDHYSVDRLVARTVGVLERVTAGA